MPFKHGDEISEPFLRWTGSKRWFTKNHIEALLPGKIKNYHEPFLGAGAVFFYLRGKLKSESKYFLSDSNEELINCYEVIRDKPDAIVSYLRDFINTEVDYYEYRRQRPKTKEQQAARFLYLNRTSFNGIYRVNSSGEFNVPYGRRPNVDVVTESLLLKISQLLKNTSLKCCHFEDSLNDICEGDLVFLDPPYTVAHENNGFIEYNQKLFSWQDQVKLREFVDEIKRKKAYFILTNASHYSIQDLYKGVASITKLTRPSQVGGRNKTRGLYNELVIHNVSK